MQNLEIPFVKSQAVLLLAKYLQEQLVLKKGQA